MKRYERENKKCFLNNLIITIINYLLKMEEDQEMVGILMSYIINYLQKREKDQKTVEILMSSIINYYKKLEKTKTVGEEIKYFHFIYLQTNFDI